MTVTCSSPPGGMEQSALSPKVRDVMKRGCQSFRSSSGSRHAPNTHAPCTMHHAACTKSRSEPQGRGTEVPAAGRVCGTALCCASPHGGGRWGGRSAGHRRLTATGLLPEAGRGVHPDAAARRRAGLPLLSVRHDATAPPSAQEPPRTHLSWGC